MDMEASMATLRPKKFLISFSLIAAGAWSPITLVSPGLISQREESGDYGPWIPIWIDVKCSRLTKINVSMMSLMVHISTFKK